MNDFRIQYFYMHVHDLAGRKFVVAKVRRVSSAPVQFGAVSDSLGSAVRRLADIFRLGKESRNYADLRAIEQHLKEQFQTDPDTEWTNYEDVVRRALGVERLDPVAPRVPLPANGKKPALSVILHHAVMNDRPYLVARVGSVLGSPAPIYMTFPHQAKSALARLRDVFRIGVSGQVFKDFVEQGRKLGKGEQEIVADWRDCERAVMP